MAKITGFGVVDEAGFPVLADPHGNNVALRCLGCSSPVLAIVRDNQRGSSKMNPSVCPACSAMYWIETKPALSQLVIHRVR